MSAQIIAFPDGRPVPTAPRSEAFEAQADRVATMLAERARRKLQEHDRELESLGRMLHRDDVSDEDARTAARRFLHDLAAVRNETAALNSDERLQRLASMIASELAKAEPRAS